VEGLEEYPEPEGEDLQKFKELISRIIKAYEAAKGDGWIKLNDKHQRLQNEMAGCIYKNGIFGMPFAVTYNEDQGRYECCIMTQTFKHIPTHVAPLPKPPKSEA
jgi:hypothetical protein